ncbi:MAG: response regulator [Bacteroidota bacterium]
MIDLFVVEDDQIDRFIIKRGLEKHHSSVNLKFFYNGHELVKFLEVSKSKHHPSLILLDINTPQLSGKEFLELYAGHPKVQFIPKIMISTSGNSRDIKECYKKGACGYFVKPVDNDQFNTFLDGIVNNFNQMETMNI